MAVRKELINYGIFDSDVKHANVALKKEDGKSVTKRLSDNGLPETSVAWTRHEYLRYKDNYNVAEYEDVALHGVIGIARLKMICMLFGLDYSKYIVPKKPEKSVFDVVEEAEKAEAEAKAAHADLTEVEHKLDEIVSDIISLNNIQMQMLEYMKTMMDYTQTCSQNLKTMNDKYNKPSAYRKNH